LDLNDLICMTKEEAAAHEREVLKGGRAPESFYSGDVVETVRSRREEERWYQKYR